MPQCGVSSLKQAVLSAVLGNTVASSLFPDEKSAGRKMVMSSEGVTGQAAVCHLTWDV